MAFIDRDRQYYRQMRRLATIHLLDDPCDSLLRFEHKAVGKLADAFFSDTSDWENIYLSGESIDEFIKHPAVGQTHGWRRLFFVEENWYLPELQENYTTFNYYLTILDATSQRYFPQAIDKLATHGCRYPRMIAISQETIVSALDNAAVYNHPISHLILMPGINGREGNIAVSEFHFPYAMNLVVMAMAVASTATK